MLLGLVATHFVLAAVAVPAGRRLGRGVFWLCLAAPLAMVVYATALATTVLGGTPIDQDVNWVPGLDLGIDLRLDGFALVMVALVSGIGVLIFAYSARYFSARRDLGTFAGALLAFSGAMLGLVLADNLFVLYVFWELTSITSYLLIGTDHERGSSRAAALQALLVTSAGGLAMLGGFVLMGQAAGTFELSEIVADPPTSGLGAAGAFLALVGAFTKSAQVPFHTWLPAAMVAPTPVSAYLHSATMVKAGVYLVARLAPAFALVAGWRPLLVTVGVATMLVGGYRALRQYDLKRLLAFGTISQLGFLITLFGVGTSLTTAAGVALLLAHAAFKAALFMVVGVVDHQAHTRDIRRLSGLGRRLPWTAAVATAAGLSMAGIPPLLGFIAKEAAFDAFLESDLGALGWVALTGVVAGSVLTVAYTARFLWGGFATKPAAGTAGEMVGPGVARPDPLFLAPSGVLAAVGLAFGLFPAALDPLYEAGARALVPGAEVEHLALWHGFTTALGLSVVAVAGGLVLFAARDPLERAGQRWAGERWAFPLGADDAYRASIVVLNRVADATTGVLQNGSLPVYLSVILGTLVALPTSALLRLDRVPLPDVVAESPMQLVVGALVAMAALGVVASRRRFTAVLLLGAVGYGVALLFVIQGAPDLALTQLLVETLMVVVFVLVLRHLPERFETAPWRLGQGVRRLIAGVVGVFVTGFALVAAGSRTGRSPTSEFFLREAYPAGEGRNVVNVVLVDFRGLDTLGEITVLTLASLGVAALVRAALRKEED